MTTEKTSKIVLGKVSLMLRIGDLGAWDLSALKCDNRRRQSDHGNWLIKDVSSRKQTSVLVLLMHKSFESQQKLPMLMLAFYDAHTMDQQEDHYAEEPDANSAESQPCDVVFADNDWADRVTVGGISFTHTAASVEAFKKHQAANGKKFIDRWTTLATIKGPKQSGKSQYGDFSLEFYGRVYPVGIPTIKKRTVDGYKPAGLTRYQNRWEHANFDVIDGVYEQCYQTLLALSKAESS